MINIDEKIENADWPKKTPDFDANGNVVETVWKPPTKASPWWERERAFNPVHVKHGEHGGEFATKTGEPGQHEHEPEHVRQARELAEQRSGKSFDERRQLDEAAGERGLDVLSRLGEESLVRAPFYGDIEAALAKGEEPTATHTALRNYKAGARIGSGEIAEALELKTQVPMALYRGGSARKIGRDLEAKILDAQGRESGLFNLEGHFFEAPDQVESWTHSTEVAGKFGKGFGGKSEAGSPRVVLIYDAPKGIHAVNLDSPEVAMGFGDEREWIVKNHKWIVTRADETKDGLVELHVIPQDHPDADMYRTVGD